jgi:hypothetical protein
MGSTCLGPALRGHVAGPVRRQCADTSDRQVAVAVEDLAVYPNGFTIHVVIALNPNHPRDMVALVHGGGPRRFPRVGVRFANGQTAGRSPGFGGGGGLRKDKDGVPTEPFVGMTGGGGGGTGWRFGAWVYPLPPDGPLEIFVGLPAAGLEEASITVDGSAVRAASERALVVWS